MVPEMQPGSETNEDKSCACSLSLWRYFFVKFESFHKARRYHLGSTNLPSLLLRGMDTGSEWRWLSFAPHSYLLTGCWELPPWMEKVRGKNKIAFPVKRSEIAPSIVGLWSARTQSGRSHNWNSGWLGMSGKLGSQMVKMVPVWCQTTAWWRLCLATVPQLSCWVWPLVSLPGPRAWTEWGFGPAKSGKNKAFIFRSVNDAAGRIRLKCHTYRARKLDESLIKNASHFDKEGLPEFFGVTGTVRKLALQQCCQSVDRQIFQLKEDEKNAINDNRANRNLHRWMSMKHTVPPSIAKRRFTANLAYAYRGACKVSQAEIAKRPGGVHRGQDLDAVWHKEKLITGISTQSNERLDCTSKRWLTCLH